MVIYSNGKSIELSSNNSSSSLDIYSTEEQIVGTWIDGRPVYEQTYYENSPSGSIDTWLEIPGLSVPDLDIFISSEGHILTTNNTWMGLNSYDPNVQVNFLFCMSNSATGFPKGCCALCYRGSAGYTLANRPLVCRIRYTKTTATTTTNTKILESYSSSPTAVSAGL